MASKRKKTAKQALGDQLEKLVTPQKKHIPFLPFLNRHKKLLIIVGALLVFIYFYILRDLPSPTKLTSPTGIPQSTQILDRDGELLYSVYSSYNRHAIPISQMPDTIKQATIAIEDQDFYRHGPLDPRGIARAFTQTVFKQNLQGGSTITQQLVKTALLTPDRTIQRKVKELILASFTEVFYSKDQILEMYLNQVPYGGANYGIEAAAQTFFNKKAKDLNLAESSLLAGLPQSPTRYSPKGAHPELAKARQKEVLNRMVQDGYITQEQKEQAENEELRYAASFVDIKAPHFVLYVKQLLVDKYGEKTVEEGGLKVTTTLDLDLQEYAQATLSAEVTKLKNLQVSNGAAIITNPATGEILAMIGSRDFFDEANDGNVNVTLAHRQPGSSIKPINYAAGLGKGVVTAASPFADIPICFPSTVGKAYCPVNYDGRFHGITQLRYALANSYNIPAVKMLKVNGVSDMIATASAMGINSFTDPSRYGLSLTLGGGEVTMLEMATAFGVFANGGYKVDIVPILKIEDVSGKVLEEYKPPASPFFAKKVIPESVAFIISHILSDNGARTAAFGSSSELVIPNKTVSVKTGTTDDKRDNWTIGYTPSHVVAVWVGNNDNTPMNPFLTSGVTGAAPIWNKLMRYALKDQGNQGLKKPDSVVGATVCADSGLQVNTQEGQPAPTCPTRFEYFIKGFTDPHAKIEKQNVLVFKDTQQMVKQNPNNPNQSVPENTEYKEQNVLVDPTNDIFCLTCPLPAELNISPTPAPNQ